MTYPPQDEYPPLSRGQKVLAGFLIALTVVAIAGCLIFNG